MKIFISLSAFKTLPLSLYRDAMRKVNNKSKYSSDKFKLKWDKDRYAKIFAKYTKSKKAYRIYLPLSKNLVEQDLMARKSTVVPPNNVRNEVQAKGYFIEDYIAGIAISKDGKRRIKIGKLLSPSTKKEFDNDTKRQGILAHEDTIICISRHPYDIAGMSTNRRWESCMNLNNGVNKEYVPLDIRYGTIIAYAIDKNDPNIEKPKSRVLIKPFYNLLDKSKTALGVSEVYGVEIPGFLKTVEEWVNKINGALNVPYVINEDLYVDGPSDSAIGNTTNFGKSYTDKIGRMIGELNKGKGNRAAQVIIQEFDSLDDFADVYNLRQFKFANETYLDNHIDINFNIDTREVLEFVDDLYSKSKVFQDLFTKPIIIEGLRELGVDDIDEFTTQELLEKFDELTDTNDYEPLRILISESLLTGWETGSIMSLKKSLNRYVRNENIVTIKDKLYLTATLRDVAYALENYREIGASLRQWKESDELLVPYLNGIDAEDIQECFEVSDYNGFDDYDFDFDAAKRNFEQEVEYTLSSLEIRWNRVKK